MQIRLQPRVVLFMAVSLGIPARLLAQPSVQSYAATQATLAATTIALSASPVSPTAGQTVTLTATVTPSTATGTVTIRDGGLSIGLLNLTNGIASVATAILVAGTHSLTATYSGDSAYFGSTSATVTLTIAAGPKVSPAIGMAALPNPATVGQMVTLNAIVLPTTATGTITFNDGAIALGSHNMANGAAAFITSNLGVGTHILTASYSGDSNNTPGTSAPVTEVINPPTNPTTASLSAAPNPAAVGQPVALTATVTPAGATGAVTFKDGAGTIGTVTLSNGSATLTTATLAAGSHPLTVLYNGSIGYGQSISAAVIEVVTPPVVNVTLSASPNPAAVGQTVTLAIAVSPPSATGTVSVLDSSTGNSLGPATLSSGTATITTSALKVGPHPLQATYSGDANNAIAKSVVVTETVSPPASTTTLSVAPASSSPGQTVVFTATVTPSGASGTVVFKDGATTLGTATLANGSGTFSTSALAAGGHILTASYSGDSNYAASVSASVTESVGPAPACAAFPIGFVPFSSVANISQPDAAGDLAVVGSMSTANFTTYQGMPVPAGPNQEFCGTVSLGPGISAIAYVPTAVERTGNFSPFAGLLVDPQASGAPFPGGIIPSSRIPATFAWRIAALLQGSTTTLSATPAASTPGQLVTLTAIVTPAAATGTVTFLEGSTILGIAGLISGTASFATSTLAAGSHVLTASYGGDIKNGASTSNPVTETVGSSATTTTLSVTPASSTSGQTVTLAATVNPVSATGTVTFQDGSTILQTAALNAGTASFATPTLATGSHLLTATYGGDARNGSSTSSPVTETVGLSTAGLTLSVTPPSSTPGQAVTLAATVSPASAIGSVTFLDGSALLGTGSLNGGTASFVTSTLATGSHLLTASYSGDSKNGAGTSNPVTETVTKQLSTTVLSASSTSPPQGQPLTLTATVTPSTATGSVAFLDSQTVLGTVTLAGGTAVFSTSTLTAGNHALSASYGGDAKVGASISPSIVEMVVSASPLVITFPNAPVALFVNIAWSQTFKASGGALPYKWTLPSNNMPDLSLTASGDTAVLSGTPKTAGTYQLTVRVQDSGSQSFPAPLTLTVNPLPAINISAPQPSTPAEQPAPLLTLTQAYPFAMTGTFTLAFAPNAPGLPAGYSDVQFPDGTTTFHITIPPNSTTPIPPIPSIQLGSVAGDIIGTLGPLTISGGVQAVPFGGPPPTIKITVPALPPIVVPGSVRITNVTATGFQVFLNASSTPRDLSGGAFVFTAAPGTQMNGCTPNCTVSFGADAAAWFASAAGVQNGGTTSLTVPFAFSGDPSVIGTVAVTLTNSVGTSAPVSGGK